jgi:hypothetical protein
MISISWGSKLRNRGTKNSVPAKQISTKIITSPIKHPHNRLFLFLGSSTGGIEGDSILIKNYLQMNRANKNYQTGQMANLILTSNLD